MLTFKGQAEKCNTQIYPICNRFRLQSL